MTTAERPFDPPLTAVGVTQGAALGRRLRDFSPPITKIFVSPLVRTVQTADAAAAELGVDALFIEPGLVEVLDTEWYCCWRCAASDKRGDQPAGSLFLTPAQLREAVTTRVDTAYKPVLDVGALPVRRDMRSSALGRARRTAPPAPSAACVTHPCADDAVHPGELVGAAHAHGQRVPRAG